MNGLENGFIITMVELREGFESYSVQSIRARNGRHIIVCDSHKGIVTGTVRVSEGDYEGEQTYTLENPLFRESVKLSYHDIKSVWYVDRTR